MKILEKLLGTDDAVATRLELARAYADIGGVDLARDFLREVLDEGNDGQRRSAESLMAQLA